jgi:hypothetical protein
MTKGELRTLRGQFMLLALMFLGSAAGAVVLASQRGFFEKHIDEKYTPLPEALRKLAEGAGEGRLNGAEFEKLTPPERLLLYDDWMARVEEGPASTPKVLLAADPQLYLARLERSLICGRPEQRRRALRFAELGGNRDAAPVLERVRTWARRRARTELAADVEAALERTRQAN